MRESIGSTQLYTVIIIFFFLIIAFMVGTITYQRTFKVNTLIVGSIERFEGYNGLSRAQINRDLETIAYPRLQDGTDPNCPPVWGSGGNNLVTPPQIGGDYQHRYCVYEGVVETVNVGMLSALLLTVLPPDPYAPLPPGPAPTSHEIMSYKQYIVVTYVAIDLPISGIGGIPIVARTNKIYCFEDNCSL